MELYERIVQGVGLVGDDAAIAGSMELIPVGGGSGRVFPPTYPVDAADREGKRPYLVEPRLVEGEAVETVLLDAVQSQSNRVEEAVEQAVLGGRLRLPYLVVEHEVPSGRRVRVSSFSAPHRYADAYFRDSMLDGVAFDKTVVGERLRKATAEDCRALYEREPFSLILGAWDSHRKGRQARFARLYRSEVFGIAPQFGRRAAGRMDPHNTTGSVIDGALATDGSVGWDHSGDKKKAKGERLSEIGHGNIAPVATHGGVTVRAVRRLTSVSFAGVARLRFGDAAPEAATAARVALVALALVGDRLAFGGPGLWLRSGCELVVEKELIGWQRRGGDVEPFELELDTALAVFERARDAAAAAGLVMADDVVRLTPGTGLRKALDHAYTAAVLEDAS